MWICRCLRLCGAACAELTASAASSGCTNQPWSSPEPAGGPGAAGVGASLCVGTEEVLFLTETRLQAGAEECSVVPEQSRAALTAGMSLVCC